jgi:predicted nucleic acid-binding protein
LLVVDASVAVQASLAEGGFEPLSRETLVGPGLLWSEVCSVLHELAWRKVFSAEEAEEALARFAAAPIERRSPRALRREAWSVADQLGWAKTYDAEYVALARLLKCPLVTTDARLRRGALRMVEVVAPGEL